MLVGSGWLLLDDGLCGWCFISGWLLLDDGLCGWCFIGGWFDVLWLVY